MDELDLRELADIDAGVVAAARDIKVLSRLSWPAEVKDRFLAAWEEGEPRLPDVEQHPFDLDLERRQLEELARRARSVEHPIGDFLADTAESYGELCALLANVGTPAMQPHSLALYGAPGAPLPGDSVTSLDAARHFVEASAQYCRAAALHEEDFCIPAEVIRDQLTASLAEVFPEDLVRVVVDPDLASKAAAGATRIRLRGSTCFSDYDRAQLLEHEAFVHSLTAINGQSQSWLKSLGLGAPRTTGTQEGLATFAELVTGSIDILRTQRIALRVLATDLALSGADFLDVFRFFLEAGQPEADSFASTMRIFRGAPLTGGVAFTKDTVYIHGLMQVHTFFRWAMQHERLPLCRMLFAGRMTLGDLTALEPFFEDGTLDGPRYLPPWMKRSSGLAAYLAFAVFSHHIPVHGLAPDHEF